MLFISGHSRALVNVRGNIDRFHGHYRGEIWMSLITCGSIHGGHEWFSHCDYSRRRQEIFMCLAVLLCKQFCRFTNGGAKISIKSYFMRSFIFCLSVFSSSEVLGKITSIWNKLPTAACWSREEKRGNCEANLPWLALC